MLSGENCITLTKRYKLHTATAVALFVAGRAGVQPRPQSKPSLTDFGLKP